TVRDMPSAWHDAMTELIQDDPKLAFDILRELRPNLCEDLSDSAPVSCDSPVFNDRLSFDFTADAVVIAGLAKAPDYGLVVEFQQKTDEKKRAQLARYAAGL
ncbi:MAG TPA: hypothetical protein VKU39_14365, partial [Streptosporangiaceae bacterium]|nr:hypothetical protein [Streptosporangiaceae bacterium]